MSDEGCIQTNTTSGGNEAVEVADLSDGGDGGDEWTVVRRRRLPVPEDSRPVRDSNMSRYFWQQVAEFPPSKSFADALTFYSADMLQTVADYLTDDTWAHIPTNIRSAIRATVSLAVLDGGQRAPAKVRFLSDTLKCLPAEGNGHTESGVGGDQQPRPRRRPRTRFTTN